ncbi:MAG TPA: pyruvate dehydrogenase (acetyl-transferring), homodimeric type [Polyangiaceae bacterium]|nr:pyruvate dehydrogenase (acetyl-transferring), homodimeric type [Polyangiaceae bacterium]
MLSEPAIRLTLLVDSFRPESDRDPQETQEWVESLESVVAHGGSSRARFVLGRLVDAAQRLGAQPSLPLVTDYVNTIPVADEPPYPGDLAMERRIQHIIRWNAAVMVNNANKNYDDIGGHISTFASSATLYEVGFNHFFRGKDTGKAGDQVYYQGHAAPGIYSRAYLEGRLTPEQLEHFRRETARGKGLSSYPHPRLMSEFWEFPTVSMGLGPIGSIYQARFNRYLTARGISDTSASKVWCFVGDGESDEPETLGALQIAVREKLDNLIWVLNCNLQRLDGPVWGNGKIIQGLEGAFRGAGWNVIKVVWGPEWDPIFARDTDGILRKHLNNVVDGQWQRLTTATGDVVRKEFFALDPRMLELVAHISDEDLAKLQRGGHSEQKVFAAYQQAYQNTNGKPTVILAHTVKGWLLGGAFEGVNVTHQKKKMGTDDIKRFRDVLELPVSDADLEHPPLYHPGPNSPEVDYVNERRRALGGFVPKRGHAQVQLELPKSDVYEEFYQGMAKGEASTTMVFSRLLAKLIRDKQIGKRIVPIIPDEARTFGMDALFGQVGIYSSVGQLYEPIDKGKLLYYKELKDGQVLQEGITEAGSMASFIAAATSYAVHGQPMIPFYVFYSMFGFQRTGDQLWAAGDSMARGFVLGATAGRTTLNGEGLQHEDGHSHLHAMTVPAVRAYDVSFAFELAAIIEDGLRRMIGEDENVYYYITLQNENYAMPAMPEGAKEGILKGLYRFRPAAKRLGKHVELWGSGSIMLQVLRAQELLAEKFGVSSDVWGVTSYQALRSDALACERWNRLHPEAPARVPYITQALKGVEGPFITASDYMKSLGDLVARWIPGRIVPLGTDGFGMSDTRDALRRHFEVDAECIAIGALDGLRQEGKLSAKELADAIRTLSVDPEKVAAASI